MGDKNPLGQSFGGDVKLRVVREFPGAPTQVQTYNDSTTIEFDASEGEHVTIELFPESDR